MKMVVRWEKKSIGEINIHSSVLNGDVGKLYGMSWRQKKAQAERSLEIPVGCFHNIYLALLKS